MKSQVEKGSGMALFLGERIGDVIRESGATEEEAKAALEVVTALVPLMGLESKLLIMFRS